MRKNILISLTAAAVCLMTLFILLDRGQQSGEMRPPLLIFCLSGLLLSTVLVCQEIRRKKDFGLILDNQILRIRPAGATRNPEQDSRGESMDGRKIDNEDVVISCFGVLIGSRVIPFNHRGIRLKKVVLSRESVILTYGTEKKDHVTRVFCSHMEKEEMKIISEKFLYETGISPHITDL